MSASTDMNSSKPDRSHTLSFGAESSSPSRRPLSVGPSHPHYVNDIYTLLPHVGWFRTHEPRGWTSLPPILVDPAGLEQHLAREALNVAFTPQRELAVVHKEGRGAQAAAPTGGGYASG
ncbi:hypothetical protein BC827DRAFT_1151800 [Russula dissimulans]|nr:hypothetical protein BC827DRAFT_1151800 [Russula dissimulans]